LTDLFFRIIPVVDTALSISTGSELNIGLPAGMTKTEIKYPEEPLDPIWAR
jgi:hypothetical protein